MIKFIITRGINPTSLKRINVRKNFYNRNFFYRCVIKSLFCTVLFVTGAGVGLCINVFMERGVPMINGGGELLLLLALPASMGVGFKLGADYTTRRRRNDNTSKHTS